MTTAAEWSAIAEQATQSGVEHAKDKEIRLLKLTIERQHARLVAMDARLEGANPELETARAMFPHLLRLRDWAKDFDKRHGAEPRVRGGMMIRSDERDGILNLARDVDALTRRMTDSHGKPCDEPGCVMRPSLQPYARHLHSDGVRQWVVVDTTKGPRRFKRGSW